MRKALFFLILLLNVNIYGQLDNELNFQLDSTDIEYKSKPLAMPVLPKTRKSGGDLFDRIEKTEASKIRLQEYSNVRFGDVYTQTGDGTYIAKYPTYTTTGESQESYNERRKNEVSNNDYVNETDYSYESNNNLNISNMDDETSRILFFAFILLALFAISELFGRAKHIGRWWTFFLLAFGFIPGSIALFNSPSAMEKPTEGSKSHKIWAWIFLIFGLINLFSFFKSSHIAGEIFPVFLVTSFYLFELSGGNIINNNPKYYFGKKSNKNKISLNNQEEIKSFRDFISITESAVKNENILNEILRFIEDDEKITLEIVFTEFQSSLFVDLSSKDISNKRDVLTVFVVKSPISGKITFFFRDSPKFVFSLTINEIYLLNQNTKTEIEIENFNVLAKEPIVGKKLTISALMLSVSAYVNKSTLLLNDGILTQHYSDAISFKSYDYQLNFNTLTQSPKPAEIHTPTGGGKSFSKFPLIIITIIILIAFIYNYQNNTSFNNQDITDESSESFVDSNAIVVDSTAEPNTSENFLIDSSALAVDSAAIPSSEYEKTNTDNPTFPYIYQTTFDTPISFIPIRETPYIDGTESYSCPNGTKVYVLERTSNSYYKVSVNNYIGYVATSFLK